jgi:hypothetical protein
MASANKPDHQPMTNELRGMVVDKTTGEALAGVKVVLEGTNQEVYTNFDGEFVFTGLVSGKCKLHLCLVAYSEQDAVITDLSDQQGEKEVIIKMMPAETENLQTDHNSITLG